MRSEEEGDVREQGERGIIPAPQLDLVFADGAGHTPRQGSKRMRDLTKLGGHCMAGSVEHSIITGRCVLGLMSLMYRLLTHNMI